MQKLKVGCMNEKSFSDKPFVQATLMNGDNNFVRTLHIFDLRKLHFLSCKVIKIKADKHTAKTLSHKKEQTAFIHSALSFQKSEVQNNYDTSRIKKFRMRRKCFKIILKRSR